MNTRTANHTPMARNQRLPLSSRSRVDEPVHIPLNRKRLMYTLGGALIALATMIAVILGMVRADGGVSDADVVDQGPQLRAGEVQRVPNLPAE